MNHIDLVQDSVLHTLNVALHVVFGTAGLLLGLIPLLTRKGGGAHRRFGRYFLVCLGGLLVTASLGVVLFRFRAFLAVITMLSGYTAYSGMRALKNKASGPKLQDGIVAAVGLAAAALFIAYIRSVRFPWASAVIYSILGSLLAYCAYDLARFLFPKSWLGRVWWYEHLVKMLATYTAVLSAFAGTVLPLAWQPYSQLLPSILLVGAGAYFLMKERVPAASAAPSSVVASA